MLLALALACSSPEPSVEDSAVPSDTGLQGEALVVVTANVGHLGQFTGVSCPGEPYRGALCSMEQEALDGSRQKEAQELRKAQANFFLSHLLPWANTLCDRIVQKSRLAYYQLLGAFTKGFLAH